MGLRKWPKGNSSASGRLDVQTMGRCTYSQAVWLPMAWSWLCSVNGTLTGMKLTCECTLKALEQPGTQWHTMC